MSNPKHKLDKQTAIPLILIALWIVVCNAVIIGLGIHHGWTLFIACMFFFVLQGDTKKKLKEIFIGGLVGLASSWLFLMAAMALTPALGHLMGAMVPLTIVIMALIVLHPVAPSVFNNVAFTYLIISTINIEQVPANTPIHMITFLVGGAIIIGGANLIIYLLTKAAMKKAAAAKAAELEAEAAE